MFCIWMVLKIKYGHEIVFIKDCTFDGVMKPEINKVIGVENIHFENVTVNGQDFKGL